MIKTAMLMRVRQDTLTNFTLKDGRWEADERVIHFRQKNAT
jgi:hypothetical protein